jgi:hypothetical protein
MENPWLWMVIVAGRSKVRRIPGKTLSMKEQKEIVEKGVTWRVETETRGWR